MSQYWTDLVHRLDPYVPGEQPLDNRVIKLNTNENPYPVSPRVADAFQSYPADRLRLYPDPESAELKQALATYHGLDAAQLFVGNGSDEVLAHAFQAFFKRQTPILFADIGYSFYPVYAALYEIDYFCPALDEDFGIRTADYRRPNGGIILTNPNAPTGIALELGAIRDILQHSDSLVLVDEAYVDFGAESAVSLIADHANLLVVRSFSKSRSLAGLRIGYAMGQATLIEGLNRIKNSFNSYPIDRLSSAAAIASIEDEAYFQQCRGRIIESREGLESRLKNLGFEVLPSSSNFLFARHPSHAAAELFASLKKAGILVRYFDAPRIDNFLRISVGTDVECDALIEALGKLL